MEGGVHGEAASGGDSGELVTASELFRKRHLAVFRFLRRLAGREELAEELTQEVFLRVVKALPSYAETGQADAWLFRIARNVWLNRRRDDLRRPEETSLEEAGNMPAHRSSVDRLDLDRALAALDDAEREAFLLREVGGLGYAEIAGIVACTPDAIRSRIYRARCALRAALSEGRGGGGMHARRV